LCFKRAKQPQYVELEDTTKDCVGEEEHLWTTVVMFDVAHHCAHIDRSTYTPFILTVQVSDKTRKGVTGSKNRTGASLYVWSGAPGLRLAYGSMTFKPARPPAQVMALVVSAGNCFDTTRTTGGARWSFTYILVQRELTNPLAGLTLPSSGPVSDDNLTWLPRDLKKSTCLVHLGEDNYQHIREQARVLCLTGVVESHDPLSHLRITIQRFQQ
jgi:hypothetical protein